MKRWAVITLVLLGLAFRFGANEAIAQIAPPLDAMDELNKAPVAAPGVAATVGQAQNVATGQPSNTGYYNFNIGDQVNNAGANAGWGNTGNQAVGGPGGSTGIGAPGGMMGPGGVRGAGARAGAMLPTPTPRRYSALRGQRVYDAVSKEILDDVRSVEITEDELDQYSDDGQSLGDDEANDGLYSQIKPPVENEFIGEVTNYYLERTIVMLRNAQAMHPLDFFGVTMMTNEPQSIIPKLREHQIARNDMIYKIDEKNKSFEGWSSAFLNPYRKEKGKPGSAFYDLYVPPAPDPPAGDPPMAPWTPLGHTPVVAAEQGQPGGAGGGPGGGGMAPLGVGRAKAAAANYSYPPGMTGPGGPGRQ
jgi:hypothetical protein